ncbi:MAG TPA: sugar ABC transporter permease [Spirochaetia bacterium]|nr:sugar ABC transporter permease [Spirochaetia bacterium]
MQTSKSLERQATATAWRYLLPATLIVAGIVGYPFAKTIYLSFFNAPLISRAGKPVWVGIGNYIYAFTNNSFQGGIVHTLYFSIVSISLNVLLGVSTALLLNQKFIGRAFVRTLVILPWALPTVVNAVLWRWIYNPSYGALNALLTQTHLISSYQSWLGSPSVSTMTMVVLADTWKNYPLVTILVLAGLQMIPGELYEAAKVDGAGRWRNFTSITLPGIRPALLVALVLKTIDGLRVFDIIYLMTAGGPASVTKTLSIYVYQESFGFLHLGQASAFSVITVAIIFIFVLVYIRVIRSEGVTG